MQQALTYRERSREYLGKAFQELEAGDLTQASEKGWGAAAQIVKAVADEGGLDHRHHARLIRLAQDFAQETGDRDMEIQFSIAQQLHGNFYEGMLNHDEIEWRLQSVERFVEKVERLLRAG